MRLFNALLLLLITTQAAFAAPAITSHSGTVGNAEPITIIGTGFGPNGPTVVLFDDFEKGTNGSNILTGTGSAQVGTWTANNGSKTYYTNTAKVSGALAFRANATIDWFSYIETSLGGDTHKIYASWWIFIPSGNNLPGYDSNRVNWKQFWVQGTSTEDDDLVIPVAVNASAPNTISSWIINGNDAREYTNYTSVSFTRGAWKRLATWLSSSASGAGELKFWDLTSSGPVQRENATAITNLDTGGAHTRVRINGYAATAQNCYPTFDDVYIAKGDYAQARIEIGNASTYSSCTDLAIVTPTSWSDTSISGVVRAGRFIVGQSAWLYVWDAEGYISPGYLITIGADGADTTAPTVTISTSDPQNIYTDSLTVEWSDADAVGVTSRKWRIGAAPDASNGTSATSPATITGFNEGNNTLYVGAGDAAGNWGSDSITVNLTPAPPGENNTSHAVRYSTERAGRYSTGGHVLRAP